jgi:metallo-beta-lactamase class B
MRWSRSLLLALVASLCALSTLRAQSAAPASAPSLSSMREAWNKPAAPFHMIGNIYYVGTAGLASYLITTPKGHILLDAGLVESAPQIEQNIQTLGFKLNDVKFLLNSHAHFDHSGGLSALKTATGGQVVASELDKSALEGGFYLGSESDHSMDSVPVKVDRAVKDGATLSLGDTTLTANLTPGHTRGCTSWSMPVKEAGKTYKVLFFCSATVAFNRLVTSPQYEGIVRDYEKTFAKAKTLKVDVFLAPHAEFFGMQDKQTKLTAGGSNPFVNPGEFRAFMTKAEADFRDKLSKQQAAATSGAAPAATAPATPATPTPARATSDSKPAAAPGPTTAAATPAKKPN